MSTSVGDLYPQLELTDTPERRMPPYARVEGQRGILGNGFLELTVDLQDPEQKSTTMLNKLTGEAVRFEFSPFEVWVDGERVSSADAELGAIEVRQGANASSWTAHMACSGFDVDLSLVVQRGDHFANKLIVFHNVKKETRLHRVSVFRQRVAPHLQVLLHDAGLYFPVVFVRARQSSVFLCMDFPGIFSSVEGQTFNFEYYPGHTLEPGRSFQTIVSHLGIAVLTGRQQRNPYHESGAELDTGEQQWFREYLRRSYMVPEVPYVEVRAPGPNLAGPSDLEVLEQCRRLEANHAFLPRMCVEPDAYPLMEAVRARAAAEGVGLTLALTSRDTENLRWVAMASDGSSADRSNLSGCLACEEYRDYLIDRYEAVADRYGFADVEVQGAPMAECHAAGHGHVPGLESLQKAFQGLVEVTGAIRESCGRASCAPPYGSYGAGLARLFDSIAVLADPHPLPLPDIHPGRLFADMGRLYFRRSHAFLLPKEMIPNTVGLIPESCPDACYPGSLIYPWYLYHDSVGWRYSLISAIATGLRHRFQALPQDVGEEDLAFARKWLQWEREHLLDLRHVEELFDGPGLSEVDGYGYATARGAVVFLFNPTYDAQHLRLRMHLNHDSEYVVREVHPREMNYRGPAEGLFRRDSELSLTLDPKEARVLEAVRRSPASAKRKRPEVFGAEVVEDNGRLSVCGKRGERAVVGVRLQGSYREEEVAFPAGDLQPHLTDWVCTERPLEQGRATLPQGEFDGVPWDVNGPCRRNVWLRTEVFIPEELRDVVDTGPFRLNRPVWSYRDRIFFVIRVEPTPFFDPIRTSARASGIPESLIRPFPMKYGIDLTPLNLGLRAWINGQECEVHPAVAAWEGYAPNSHPVTAYFFEASSRLHYGHANRVVLYANHFDPRAFRGIYIEHLPALTAERELDVSWLTVPSESY